eukprot:TRINITY_DN269_c0_g1_i1.p1 TRINITY_DN269_c0_g1~~TRINITY_DN269_c0_g1_i1.p1  ORF type:complete len:428 (+),score=110.04 TRINITY_DN269_c0_g1_i1:96-1379(+)
MGRVSVAAAASLLLAGRAAGHGTMVNPPARNAGRNATVRNDDGCLHNACMFFSQGCTIGCKCNEDNANLFGPACWQTKVKPTVNKPEWRTYNRHPTPAPAAGGCKGPAGGTLTYRVGECMAVEPKEGPWVYAECKDGTVEYCEYMSPGCMGKAIFCGSASETKCSYAREGWAEGTCDSKKATLKLWYSVPEDWTKYHPWRSPGAAGVLDACGLAGGSTKDNTGAGGIGWITVAGVQGYPGSKLPPVDLKTTWKAGTEVEVSWGITANHGGGYQYRLCPRSSPLTEECFQKMPLEFVGSTQVLRWNNGEELVINATRVAEGTTPAGSTWSMVPLPACTGVNGGFLDGCVGPQFPPPPGCNETCWGYERCPAPVVKGKPCHTKEIPRIVDKVRVPKDLAAGEYVVGWRWDCEQTPQIWSACGDVTVVSV